MKVLLLKDVDNLGYAGDVKKVADGFGRNFLLPRNLAVLATPGALKQADTIRKAGEKHRARELEDARGVAGQLVGVELVFERRAGETGKLYGSVTSSEIAEAIQAKTGLDIDRRKVALHEPLRSLGEHEVTVKLMMDVVSKIKVHVVPEGSGAEKERQLQAPAARPEEAAAPVEEATA